MKKNKSIIALATLFFSIFTLGSLGNKNNDFTPVKADDEWTTINTKATAKQTVFLYNAGDSYIFFNVTPNDYTSMSSDYTYVVNTPYYNTADYNFLTHIQLSNDNQNYIPFSTIYFDINYNFFFKDGTFRFGLRRNIDTIVQDGTYQYIKVLEGCEFPSYSYCMNGGTKQKCVQENTTISKLRITHDYEQGGVSEYQEMVEKPRKTFKQIAPGWNNASYGGDKNFHQLILTYGDHGVDYLSNDHTANATNRAKQAYDIGNKLTINGLPIYKINSKFGSTHVGYDHGYAYLYIQYPVEVLLMNKNNLVPTLHIEEGTEFIDVTLSEVTLKFVGGVWTVSDSEDFRIENPMNLDDYLLVSMPHEFGTTAHAIMGGLPAEGVKLAFTINLGDFDLTNTNLVFNIDGLYHCLFLISPSMGAVLLLDKDANNAVLQQFNGYAFANNTDYAFEIEITCTSTETIFKLAINHFLVINYTLAANRAAACDMWVIDTSGCVTMDYYKEVEAYKPAIVYGGTSTYDFMEGDPLYNFAGVVDAVDLYSDDVSYANLEFIYPDGAVTDNRYNAGTWTLTISLSIEGYETNTKVVTIRVHSKTSMAKIYYDDADPIEVPIGSKLVPPPNPNTYREGDYDYVFDGWYFEGAKWDFENDVVQGDMHLYAHYKKTTPHYIVTVVFEGIPRSNETYSLTKGSSLPFVLFELDGATYEVYLGNNKITSLVVQDDITITVKYTVVFTYVEPKEPTCTEDGNVGYWYSPVYKNYYFADPEGRELIPDAILPKLNHNIIHLDYMDSSCHELGHIECYYCENCHKHFSDENGQNEIENWSIAKKPHILTHHPEVAATCEEDGHIEHWTCQNEPGVYYGDEQCSIILENVIIPAIGHDYRAPTYTWRETDNGYECIASILCTHCNEGITETKLATKVVVRESSCSREGQVSYSVRFDDPRFNAQTKIVALPMTPHNYVFIEEVNASTRMEGIMAHYECSECHKCFLKDGEEYKEVDYTDLYFKYKTSKGCGGSITISSLLVLASGGALSVLLMLRRKEER